MRLCRPAALMAAALMVLFAAPPAAAEPDEPPAPAEAAPATVPLSLPELGAAPAISFNRINRDNAVASVTFAVPTGMVPVGLRATFDLPVSLRFGTVTVTQGDRTISRVGLPLQDGSPVAIPLPGVQTSGNAATLTLRVVALTAEPYCWDGDAPMRLSNVAVDFTGTETPPRNVSEFLPPVLRRVVIGVPGRPSLAESTAAVRVAAAVAGRNGQKIDVTVVALPEGRSSVDLPAAPPGTRDRRPGRTAEGPVRPGRAGDPGAADLREGRRTARAGPAAEQRPGALCGRHPVHRGGAARGPTPGQQDHP